MNLVMSIEERLLEAVVQKCSIKKMFLEISENWLENICVIVFLK